MGYEYSRAPSAPRAALGGPVFRRQLPVRGGGALTPPRHFTGIQSAPPVPDGGELVAKHRRSGLWGQVGVVASRDERGVPRATGDPCDGQVEPIDCGDVGGRLETERALTHRDFRLVVPPVGPAADEPLRGTRGRQQVSGPLDARRVECPTRSHHASELVLISRPEVENRSSCGRRRRPSGPPQARQFHQRASRRGRVSLAGR
jgi:hypothetical protein